VDAPVRRSSWVSGPTGEYAHGVALPPVTVQILDSYGNVVTSDNTDTVSLAVPAARRLHRRQHHDRDRSQCVATFSNLTLVKPGNYTLSELVPSLYRAQLDVLHDRALAGASWLVCEFALGLLADVQCAIPGQFDDAGALWPGLWRHAPVRSVTLTGPPVWSKAQ